MRAWVSEPNSQGGAALIYVLIALAALSAMMGLVFDNLSELRTALGTWTWKVKAEASAESALEVASLKLLDDPLWKAGEDTAPEMQIQMTDAQSRLQTAHMRIPDLVKLTAIGKHRGGRHRAVRTTQIIDPTRFVLIGRKRVSLQFGTTVRGSVLAGEDIDVDRGVDLKSLAGVTSLLSGKQIHLTVAYPNLLTYENARLLPMPTPIDIDELKKLYATQIAGSVLTDVKLAGISVLKDGALTIVDGGFSDVSMFVTEDLHLMGAPKMSAKGDTPILIVQKNLIANFAGAEIRGIIYVGGKVTLRGQGVITGTIIAEEIDAGGGIAIQSFDEDAAKKRPTASFFKREIRWVRTTGGEGK